MNVNKNSPSYSLREGDLREALNYQTTVIPYDSLSRYRSIHDLLGRHGNCILLYRHGPNTGHWVAVLYSVDNMGQPIIEVFDPYGTRIDRQFESPSMIEMNRYLSRLLLKAGMPIHYNHYNFQRHADNINTCGRHTAYRIMNRDLTLEEYKQLLDNYMFTFNAGSYDELMTHLVRFS